MVRPILPAVVAVLSLVTGASAANIAVRVIGVTSTQAVLSYDAPDANACVATVTDSANQPVHDTDESLLAGSSSDLRAGNSANGLSRVVIIGQRNSGVAADGKLYSRALQADSAFQFQVACDGGAATGSATFRTRTVLLGNSAPDPFPFNSNGFGNYGYPNVNYANSSLNYIDPQTGVLLRRLTGPGQSSTGVNYNSNVTLADDLAGTVWTAPGNVLVRDGQYASYSGAGGTANSLFTAFGVDNRNAGYSENANEYPDDLNVHFFGYGDQANAADRTVQMCLTIDHGQTCLGSVVSVVLPQGLASAADVATFSTFPRPILVNWGSPTLHADYYESDWGGNATGTVSGSVLTNTTATGATPYHFPLWIKPGMTVLVAGSAPTCPNNECTISALTSDQQLTLQQNLGTSFAGASTTLVSAVAAGATSLTVTSAAGFIYSGFHAWRLSVETDTSIQCSTLTGAVFSGCSGINSAHSAGAAVTSTAISLDDFGLKTWKQTATGSVFVDSVSYDLSYSAGFYTTDDGAGYACHNLPVSVGYAADGVTPLATAFTGNLCIFQDFWGNPQIYLLNISTGESRLIAHPSPSGVSQTPSNPLQCYQYASSQFQLCTYDAVNGKYQDITGYSGANPYWSCTNLTAGTGNDVVSQIAAAYPQIDMTYFGQPQFGPIAGNYVGMILRPYQNAISWGCVFDLSKPAGTQLVRCSNTFSTYPLRWGGVHGGYLARTADGWVEWASVIPTLQYSMKLNTIYNNGGSTALTSTFIDPSTCETLGVTDTRWIALGATGNNCIKVNVATEPVNTSPSPQDLVSGITAGNRPVAWPQNSSTCGGDNTTSNCWSYLQPVQEGDFLTDPNDNTTENFLVAKKIPLSNGTIDLVLARAVFQYGAGTGCGATAQNHASGFLFDPVPAFNCGANNYWANFQSDPTYTEYADYHQANTAHQGLEYLPASHSYINYTDNQYSLGNFGIGYGVRQAQLPSYFSQVFQYGVNMSYPFSGALNEAPAVQSHPGQIAVYDATGNRLVFGLDGRPLGGAGGGVALAWYHSYTPVSGMQNVYKISPPLDGPNGNVLSGEGLNRKRRAVYGWYGYTQLKDISGPGSQITDSTPDSFCIADFAGECAAGSLQGDRFISVAKADVTSDVCYLGYDRNTPCLSTVGGEVANFVEYDIRQADPTGLYWRKISSWFGGPGRTNNYANVHGTDGSNWIVGPAMFADGVRTDLFGALRPSWVPDSENRGDFIHVRTSLGGHTGDTVRIRFGYNSSLYCTTRQEQCSTGAANGDPFAWLSEAVTWQACDQGCSIDIPAMAGRILYYVVDRKNSAGQVVSSALQVRAVN